MDVEALLRVALREAGYGPDAIGSALPRWTDQPFVDIRTP